MRRRTGAWVAGIAMALGLPCLGDEAPRVEFARDDAAGQMRVLIGGKEAVVYQYGAAVDLPHYFPVRSPSGRPLTVQRTEPYPHHRSVWFADAVEFEGHKRADIYAGLYTQIAPENAAKGYRNGIKHVAFVPEEDSAGRTEVTTKLVWIVDTDVPVLDEVRTLRVVPLGEGEYLLDLTFTLTAAHGDVKFVSDAVHYAWPFVRMNPEFSVDRGGTITNSEGGRNQAGTNMKPAVWVDYSNTIEGKTEGLAILSHPQDPQPHAWLTRDYGTFGPRRVDARSGKPFVLGRGDSIVQRVGILVHRGDVASGRVAERYRLYTEGRL